MYSLRARTHNICFLYPMNPLLCAPLMISPTHTPHANLLPFSISPHSAFLYRQSLDACSSCNASAVAWNYPFPWTSDLTIGSSWYATASNFLLTTLDAVYFTFMVKFFGLLITQIQLVIEQNNFYSHSSNKKKQKIHTNHPNKSYFRIQNYTEC